MTKKEIALQIGTTIRELPARQTAYETLLSRIRLNGGSISWKDSIERDLKEDIAPSSLFGRSVARLSSDIAEATDDSLLEFVYNRLFLPDYDS